MAHYVADITNTPKSCTYASIYLGITGNIQGTKKVLNLMTRTVKKPRNVTAFPMPDCIIDLVNKWGQKYQKEEKKYKLEFLNCVQLQYDWDNNKFDSTERLVVDNAHEDIVAWFPGIELE